MELNLHLHPLINIRPARGTRALGLLAQDVVEEPLQLLQDPVQQPHLHLADRRLLAGGGGVQAVAGAAPLLAALPQRGHHVAELLVRGHHLLLQLLQVRRAVRVITFYVVQVLVNVAEGPEVGTLLQSLIVTV